MTILLRIGGIRFRFDSDIEILIEESLSPFFCTTEMVSTVNVRFIHCFTSTPHPHGPMLGEDLLMEYYQENGQLLCLTKGSQGQYLSCCICSEDLRELTCYLNFSAGSSADSLGNLIRMIPLRRILLQDRVLFFHASQIQFNGVGILFSAASQTGKTTQAKLWRAYRHAEILCNDRTLTDGLYTYGFPVDGSEPVISGKRSNLGAIVLLEQSPQNQIVRLSPRKAVPRLMQQLILDAWDSESAAYASDLLLELMVCTPVYLLRCTPDEGAVTCLEQQLRKDGVISYE